MDDRKSVAIDGAELDVSTYSRMHSGRIDKTMELLRKYGGRRIIELGAHPRVMTSALSDDSGFDILATVSAEEATLWPDDFGFSHTSHTLRTVCGRLATIKNYSFHAQRRLVHRDESPDAVLACEIDGQAGEKIYADVVHPRCDFFQHLDAFVGGEEAVLLGVLGDGDD